MKGRHALNSVVGVGVRKKGVSMEICTKIFWAFIMPIVTFGCELGILSIILKRWSYLAVSKGALGADFRGFHVNLLILVHTQVWAGWELTLL